MLALREGSRVLEIGCGHGHVSERLAAFPRIRWTGVDISSSMMRDCLKQIHDGSGTVADALSLPFKAEAFDAVLCNGVPMHIEHEAEALSEMARVLRPGGRLVVSGNNLLSPFALPAWAWNAARGKFKQSFRLPWVYRHWLSRSGFRVESMNGDTLLAVGMHLPGKFGSIPPERWFKLMVLPDRYMEGALRYFAYEIWFGAVKQPR
jgi:SAM-dependent methyltransferase